jgi:tRNA-splicing ligase RtcB (3'-phosphate/5'-hydroxy nucleic acid ligase)
MNKVNDKLLSWASTLEEEALNQAIITSHLPFIHGHVALMPDAHYGMGSTVGSVIPTLGAVVPSAVGVDIGCGMIAVKTQLVKDDLAGKDLSVFRHSIERSIPLSVGNGNRVITDSAQKRIDELEKKAKKDYTQFANWKSQLGSLGSGNHFIEVSLDENDNVWIFLHSGSRGVGNKIAQYHIKIAQGLCKKWFVKLEDPDLAYLVDHTEEFYDYIRDLLWAQDFALANREEMMDRVIKDLSYFMKTDIQEIERINCHHNFTKQEHHFGKDVWLTRKGAIEASEGKLGLIPGSMGTRSYIVEGKGFKPSFNSAPHGAGRAYSRTKARQTFTFEDLKKAMEGIEFRQEKVLIDEIPQAYKDIDQVMEDARDLVAIKHTLRQILNVKGD